MKRRTSLRVLLTGVLGLPIGARAATVEPPERPTYDTLFYTHDGLRLEAYLYKPQGAGPFPLVVYNHGSAPPGDERKEWPAPFIARLLVPEGFAVLVPGRRGYGKSEGPAFSEEIGQDRGPRYVARLRLEAADVNAAVEHALVVSGSAIDPKRVSIMGARAICQAIAANGTPIDLQVYPPFDRGQHRPGNPPGHALFGPSGVSLWQKDVLAFLTQAMPAAR